MRRVVGNQPEQGSAPALLSKGQAKAQRFLLDLLARGPVPTSEIKRAAQTSGCAWASVRRAQQAVGAKAVRHGEEGRRGGGSWWWVLGASVVEHLKDSPNEHLNVLASEPTFSDEFRPKAGVALSALSTLTEEFEIGPDEEEL
ncbi:hypothetical protein [Pseudomonas sp. Nvir]|uniref:hypothetical protein n=1 Tax=Pseudomonas sp. Nvir TaxID=2899657 RepID=UPI001E30BD88|nr:hypothetical protein [Pseudomonas sp. Nvir]CAH0650514.1 hypothetical protein PSNVIR_04814 [Pseudomonas sp. Nvir]